MDDVLLSRCSTKAHEKVLVEQCLSLMLRGRYKWSRKVTRSQAERELLMSEAFPLDFAPLARNLNCSAFSLHFCHDKPWIMKMFILQDFPDYSWNCGDLRLHGDFGVRLDCLNDLPLHLWMYKGTLVPTKKQRLFTNPTSTWQENRRNLEKWTWTSKQRQSLDFY